MIKFLPVQTKLDRQVIRVRGTDFSAAYSTAAEGTSERAILDYGFVSGVEWVFQSPYMNTLETPKSPRMLGNS